MPACRFRRWPMRLSLRPVAAPWRGIDASMLDGWVIHWESVGWLLVVPTGAA
ncbi:MAG: hypothetical protein ACKN81_01655 [Pirellulaceae bacterium]